MKNMYHQAVASLQQALINIKYTAHQDTKQKIYIKLKFSFKIQLLPLKNQNTKTQHI